MKNNKVIVDLSKVQWALFGYRNQYGDYRNRMPPYPSTRNREIEIDELMYNSSETALAFAKRNGLLDEWIPSLRLKITANTWLTYTGDKAISIYKEYCARIFSKNKRK